MFSQFLAFFGADLSGVFHVALIAYQYPGDIVGGMFLDLVHPVLNGTEALSVCYVVGHNDSMRTLVVTARDSLEPFLTSCVPLYTLVKTSSGIII